MLSAGMLLSVTLLLFSSLSLLEDRSLDRQSRLLLLEIQNGPIKHVIILKALAVKELLEESFKISIVRTIFETKRATVFKVRAEFGRVSLAQLFSGGRHFAVHNSLVFLFLSVGFESLPGKGSADKVHEYITEGFKIITARLLNSNVSINRCITCCSSKVLVLTVGNVLV